MSTVIIDGATRDKLLAASGEIELRDETGTPIGKFVKYTKIGKYIVEGEWPSDEELDRRTREGKRYSADQVEERLRKLKETLG
ncbi:hypothetical protein [Fimbriiglobus ruber]|uniref:Uncharacterized protein n=1 Tax=Fimbriiglobus ruber TaxID=1908690 RepID=A0A225DLS7_9BACT|nr:hypothetical protein [Fimbriiglobus ruber]OWK38159.1 hypothetical protein FRUB_07279 [Fimbriiglobus ruber]